jgi:hypothetical protein
VDFASLIHPTPWAELRRALIADPGLREKVKRVCLPQVADPYAQRHYFWLHYVRQTSS